jgi:cell division protein FtsI/penicillin-binding protein 2
MEVGSIMKTLTMAAGLNEGAVKPSGTFFDSARITVDNETITNVEEDGGPAQRTIPDILRYSLNTGAVYILQQIGGGKINEKARKIWHGYLTERYGFGKKTGIEQGYEAGGSVPSPTEGFGLNIQYANSSFGQGITITPLQFISAYSATINGGNYFRPHLIEPEGAKDKQNLLVRKKIVKPEVSGELRAMHQNSVNHQYPFLKRDGYNVGGKTGTPEIPSPDGGYYQDRFNGTFVGYIGGRKPEYAIMVRVNEPVVDFYAGTAAAAPLFGKVVDMLINNYSLVPL